MHKRLYSFLAQKHTLSQNQFVFRKKHNTIDAITKFIADATISLDHKESTLATYLDLSKAFDTIHYDIMFKNLSFYGIRGIALTWFKSYLTNRKQYVQNLNCKSDTKTLLNGVPQGSVLGPLLFILYINDMSNIFKHAKSVIFADDTAIYITGNDIENFYIDKNKNKFHAIHK